jgi:5-methylcytosine-specific restriction endonuclease McrA
MKCAVEDCNNSVHAKGYCNTHYRRFLKFNDPLKTEISPPYRGKKCSVEDCTEKAYKKGMCNKHFQRVKKFGTTELPKKICSVVDCGREIRDGALGFCGKHYQRFIKRGNTDDPKPKQVICKECGVNGIIKRGLCENCYHSFMMKNSETYYSSKKLSAYKRRSLDKNAQSEQFTLEEILDKTSGLCSLCFETIDISISGSHRLGLTIDHIQPLSKGGNSMKYNLLAAHRICNSIKQHRWKNSFTTDEYVNILKIQNEKFWKEKFQC